ncbi:hypothetical protein BZG36_05062 [Bifiguratus adelaidae]|uniref:Histone deacetylase interacting domain-containing protein n=1 Tax=Bifiguratus adelaidae TaxID=1938954 RepID=A0A261XV92_9FUNG|nr:hypothetical protein BZG36_05062 [Bifiguratus adelaidae]
MEAPTPSAHGSEPPAANSSTPTHPPTPGATNAPPPATSPHPPASYANPPPTEASETSSQSHLPPPPPAIPASSQQSFRPLNVKDALTYLDQVKVQFSDLPDVYNQFLDIMKDFKSQAIDTPGVIERVSTLFRGHPSLISGFNTFLPPGYRIECLIDNHDNDLIRVTTPTGTTSTTSGGQFNFSNQEPGRSGRSAESGYSQHTKDSYGGGGYMSLPSVNSMVHPQLPSGPPMASAGLAYSGPPPPAPDQTTRKPPVEFNHAINYVNKIKNRYANDPDSYKQFLEILRTYQKEQKPIQEVYAQVQGLFGGAPDLLDEFKQFLPDTSGNQTAASSALFGVPYQGSVQGEGYRKSSHMPSSGPNAMGGMRRGKRGSAREAPVKPKRSKYAHKDMDYGQTSAIRQEPYVDPATTISAEEAEFFDRVRRHINNKSVYNEFLKVLNLFSQQIVDQNILVERVESFIGGNRELFDWFKAFVHYDGKDEHVDNVPVPDNSALKPDLVSCRAYGPSYRVLPKSWQTQPCSGRDELCFEVLNDEYVSHPTWASEEAGFIASKKNQFEEALHRCEEERYDYDLNIEANLNTIALLEPIAKKIAAMTPDERAVFKLPLGLGGPSKTIYQRIIKKVYGPERGLEIIDALHENPAQAVPVVLSRLKQKDEEWKRSQREWNKVWRAIDKKNYYKSLDYQGITFKTQDKKTLAPRNLVLEAETLRREQIESGLKLTAIGRYQFRFDFSDKGAVRDVVRLVYSYLDRTSSVSMSDSRKIRALVGSLAEDQLGTSVDMLDAQAHTNANGDVYMHYEPESAGMNPYGQAYPSRASGDGGNHLLRDVLTRNVDTRDEVGNQEMSNGRSANQSLQQANGRSHSSTAFGSNTWYCAIRLIRVVYERLKEIKGIADEMLANPKRVKRQNQNALELALTANQFAHIEKDLLSGQYYEGVLDLIDKLYEDEIDQQNFEDLTRYIFGTKAYILFTVEKVVHQLVKQLQFLINDPKCAQTLEMFFAFEQQQDTSRQTLNVYRKKVEELVGQEDNVYRISYSDREQVLYIQMMGAEEILPVGFDDHAYQTYVENYMDWTKNTDDVDISKIEKPYLKRNMKKSAADNKTDDLLIESGMEYKICKNTYHLFYITGSEDLIQRKRQKRVPELSKNSARWSAWLNSDKGWARGLTAEERNARKDESRDVN